MAHFATPSVMVLDVYQAARETCARLHKAHIGTHLTPYFWTVEPYPNTAAIHMDHSNRIGKLYMPAMPLDGRMNRAQAEMLIAYTIHELGHACYTDFSTWEVAKREKLTHLLNGIEDVRIEAKLARSRLLADGKGELERLAVHVTAQSLANGWNWNDPRSLAFNLYQFGAIKNLGYTVPNMLPLSDIAPGLLAVLDYASTALRTATSTYDALLIAREVARRIRDMNGKSPEEQKQIGRGQPGGAGQSGEAQDGAGAGQGAGEGDKDGKGSGTGAGLSYNANPSDDGQRSPEVTLQDIANAVCNQAGLKPAVVAQHNAGTSAFVNVAPCDMLRAGDDVPNEAIAAKLAALIPAPARLRRDVRMAVRSPERVTTHRRELFGRFDMREHGRAQAGAVNVFKRREDEEGRNAAVSLLLDMSSSMQGANATCAVALALQLGDALKQVNAPFEVGGFFDGASRTNGARLMVTKTFSQPWQKQRATVGGMVSLPRAGTAQMPAVHAMARRMADHAGVSRRILLVLADGGDGFSIEANAACMRYWKRRGVEIVMIGCLTDVSRYGAAHVNVFDLQSLATGGPRHACEGARHCRVNHARAGALAGRQGRLYLDSL